MNHGLCFYRTQVSSIAVTANKLIAVRRFIIDSASSGPRGWFGPGPIEEVGNSSPPPPEAATSQDRLASHKGAVTGDREYLTSSSSSLSALEQALPAKDVRRQGCPHPRFADSYFIGAGAASIKPATLLNRPSRVSVTKSVPPRYSGASGVPPAAQLKRTKSLLTSIPLAKLTQYPGN